MVGERVAVEKKVRKCHPKTDLNADYTSLYIILGYNTSKVYFILLSLY